MINNKRMEELLQYVKQEKFLIYGAGIVATEISVVLRECFDCEPQYYVVSKRDTTVNMLHQVPILTLREMTNIIPKKRFIILATPEIYQEEICEQLEMLGYKNYRCIDYELEYLLTAYYLKVKAGLIFLKENRGEVKDISAEDFMIYMAKSDKDKKLKKTYELPEWITQVQAGAAIANEKVAVIGDDTKENISNKNRNYSELTVTYWVWKNIQNKYKGICHYRRMFLLSEQDIYHLMQEDVDMIVPSPYICFENISEQYTRYISQEDMSILIRIMVQSYPKMKEAISKILNGKYIYNYNMLIAKTEVFDEYCNFLFTILEKVEVYNLQNHKVREDRYIGYLGEIVTTVFILNKMSMLKVVHVPRVWMI